jgi:hypothetical protein
MYDSKLDTLLHRNRVEYWILRFLLLLKENFVVTELPLLEKSFIHRANIHDKSKLGKYEKGYYDIFTSKLKQCEYGSDEYKKYLDKMQIAIKHHYNNNRHHPEYSGYNNMTTLDKIEMLCDWLAATERNKNGNIIKSIEIGKMKYKYDEKEYDILLNTAKMLQENKADKNINSLFIEVVKFMKENYGK